jgi:protein gp37
MAETSIEWTDATWNPVAGCTIVTAGCTNCYAMKMAARLEAMGVEKYKGLTRKSGNRHVWSGKLRFDGAALEIPAGWKKARRVFVNSMSDLFHEDVPTDFIALVWRAMALSPQHTFQILTKRPERMAEVLRCDARFETLSNVWLGASVEDSRTLGRLDDLRRTRSAVRFVSFEPLIGSVSSADLRGIDWAIVGGESGPNARPMKVEWLNEIHAMCEQTGTAFFFKQWGGRNKKASGRSYRGRTWDYLPELRI